MENSMRVERLIPIHDLRPALARMRMRLERIQEDMGRLGAEAKGPGDLALGRGYAFLGDPDKALAVLNRSWNGGYRTPEVAYALCRVACDHYLRLADLDPPSGPEQARQLQAAREFFTLSEGAVWEPRELAEARLLSLEGSHSAALAKARGVHKEYPWMHEAKVEEAFALTGLGLASQRQGASQAALTYYREASLAARLAQTVGHSDESCYLADLEWRLRWLENPALGREERMLQLAEAEALADQILVIRPDSPLGVRVKSYVIIRRATALAQAGQDPEPELDRAERFLAPLQEVPGLQAMVGLKRSRVQELRASRAAQGQSRPWLGARIK
jgi:hypothetical protein